MVGSFPTTLELEAILRISDERLVLMLPTGRGITSRSVSPVRIAYLGRSDLLKREVERR